MHLAQLLVVALHLALDALQHSLHCGLGLGQLLLQLLQPCLHQCLAGEVGA